ncbi:MAG: hypothetical protein AAF184_17085 [Pseudomonadota bacterium]
MMMRTLWPLLCLLVAMVLYVAGSATGAITLLVVGAGFEIAFWLGLLNRK